jgi:hypothetical protein
LKIFENFKVSYVQSDQSKLAAYSMQVYNEHVSMTATGQEKLRQVRDKAAEFAAKMLSWPLFVLHSAK